MGNIIGRAEFEYSVLSALDDDCSGVLDEEVDKMCWGSYGRTAQRKLADMIVRFAPLDDIREFLETEGDADGPVTKGLRPLHYAVFQQNVDAVNLLLLLGCNIDATDDIGYTALHVCAERGYGYLVNLLLSHNARVCFSDLRKINDWGENPRQERCVDEPLRLAIRNHHYEVAELLLKNGADPNAHYYLGHEINLIDPLELRMLELLLKFGADPNSRDRSTMTPLMNACRKPEGVEAAYLLVSYGADVNAMSNEEHEYRTALHYAVISGNLELVDLLVSNGADVKFSNYKKPTPVYFAVLKGNVDALKFLIAAGADVNVGSTVVGTPLHVALCEKIPNQIDIIQALLASNANPNAYIQGERGPVLKPPLGEYFQSCEQPDIKIVRMLLQYGARVILKGQQQHPLGILKSFHRINLGLTPEVTDIMLDAAEEFGISLVQESDKLSEEQKGLILDRAMTPRTLKEAARRALRYWLGTGPNAVDFIRSAALPKNLKSFLMFEG